MGSDMARELGDDGWRWIRSLGVGGERGRSLKYPVLPLVSAILTPSAMLLQVTIDASTNLPVLTSMTRNISHKKIIHVAEDVQFHPAAAPARFVPISCQTLVATSYRPLYLHSGTIQTTIAYVSSNFGSGSGLSSLLRGRIEQYGAGRFERNARNVRAMEMNPVCRFSRILTARFIDRHEKGCP